MGEHLRQLHAVPDPLGLYIRPGHNGHLSLAHLLGEGDHPIRGAVLGASHDEFQANLRRDLRSKKHEIVLDSQAMELATAGGFERTNLQRLQWAGNRVHRPEDLIGGGGLEVAAAVAKHVVEKGYTAVLSPTHFLTGPRDPWFEVDVRQVVRLRRYLDANGAGDVLIYYLLAIHSDAFRDAGSRAEILGDLAGLDIDGLWLRVHPFGTNAGSVSLRRYIEACQDLHRLRIPIVADRVGSAGMPLLAFGAVGGITTSMSVGETFNAKSLARPPGPNSRPNMAPRVYVEAIGAYLSVDQARAFFARKHRTQAKFGCRDKRCCRHGASDMLGDPRRHHFLARTREVARLSAPPPTARATIYMDRFLRPASDKVIRAAQVDGRLMKHRRRLEGWRQVLGALEEHGVRSHARVPKGRRVRRRRLRARSDDR